MLLYILAYFSIKDALSVAKHYSTNFLLVDTSISIVYLWNCPQTFYRFYIFYFTVKVKLAIWIAASTNNYLWFSLSLDYWYCWSSSSLVSQCCLYSWSVGHLLCKATVLLWWMLVGHHLCSNLLWWWWRRSHLLYLGESSQKREADISNVEFSLHLIFFSFSSICTFVPYTYAFVYWSLFQPFLVSSIW